MMEKIRIKTADCDRTFQIRIQYEFSWKHYISPNFLVFLFKIFRWNIIRWIQAVFALNEEFRVNGWSEHQYDKDLVEILIAIDNSYCH